MVAHAPDGKWLYLFHPEPIPDVADIHAANAGNLITPALLRPEKLVNMKDHDYRLEPNGVFTPDGKLILFVGIQNHGQGLRVLTQHAAQLNIGDLVDVIGFPAVGSSAPVLEDAVFHRVGSASPPQPIKLDVTIPWEQFDGALVTADATLLQLDDEPDGRHLRLQQGDIIFEAVLEHSGPLTLFPSIPVNSKIRVAGICLVSNGGLWSVPQSFRILLRSTQDVTVLQSPPWWNLRHALWLVGIMSGILLAVLAAMFILSRKVREQMIVIRQKLQHGAVLEERNRIARELHDTLEQELAGITMQLDLAVDCFRQAPRVAFQALDAARSMSRHSMVEARRSVWDLRCDLLEQGDLPYALGQIMRPLVAGNAATIDVNVSGAPVRLAGKIEMNLLRIGQEAVANAVKHGHASHIQIELQYGMENVTLKISDNGCGFVPDQSNAVGHFGMLDMRERAESLDTRLQVQSEPGRGTQITVEVNTQNQPKADVEPKTHTYSGGG